jgi:hypothetical protein
MYKGGGRHGVVGVATSSGMDGPVFDPGRYEFFLFNADRSRDPAILLYN